MRHEALAKEHGIDPRAIPGLTRDVLRDAQRCAFKARRHPDHTIEMDCFNSFEAALIRSHLPADVAGRVRLRWRYGRRAS